MKRIRMVALNNSIGIINFIGRIGRIGLICLIAAGPTLAAGLEQAETAFLKGDYDAAVKNCNEAISSAKNIDLAEAYCLKARILLKQNKMDEAQEVFKKVLADFSGSQFCQEAQAGLGDVYFAEENFDGAVGEYRKFKEKYPKSQLAAIVLYKLGRSCIKAGRLQEARFYFQKLQQDYPFSFESKLVDELDDSQFAYSVQVGCFSKYENAENLVKRLKKEGFDAYVSEKESYPVFYRVRVGNFKTENHANSCKLLLQKKGYKTKLCP